MSTRSLPARMYYDAFRFIIRLALVPIFGFRCFGRHKVPRDGAILVCANHQSVLDPPVIGCVFDRRLNYLARRTLFRFAPFRWLIRSLDAIPIERDGMGMAGLKESLRRLKRGEGVIIFPEGTRSHDGEVAPLKPGFCVLARRVERHARAGGRRRGLPGLAAFRTGAAPDEDRRRHRGAALPATDPVPGRPGPRGRSRAADPGCARQGPSRADEMTTADCTRLAPRSSRSCATVCDGTVGPFRTAPAPFQAVPK